MSQQVNFFDRLFTEWFPVVWPYVSTFVLAAWGGIVSYGNKVRKGQLKFNFVEFLIDLSTSTFAGLLTYFACQYAGLDQMLSAALIAISGHMGAKALGSFEKVHKKVFGE